MNYVNSTPSQEFSGFIKTRIIHARHRTILLPDHIVVCDEGTYWLQPHWISPPLLNMSERASSATLFVDIVSPDQKTARVEVTLSGEDLVTSLDDRSQVYRCSVKAPRGIKAFRAGRARVLGSGRMYLRLNHHTTAQAKKLIKQSGHVRGSAWNYQGNKKLENVSYAYFTSLTSVTSDRHLQQIAMASDGRLHLGLDQAGAGASPDLTLDVYRESTANRTSNVPLWVPADHVAPSHIWMHTRGSVDYEVTHPFIFRVPLSSDGRYAFDGDKAQDNQPDMRRFDYLVLGDCTTLEGLRAPYDEENTEQTFAIADLAGSSIFEYWLEHANESLWTTPTDLQEFSSHA